MHKAVHLTHNLIYYLVCFSLLLINLPWSIFNTIKGYADVMKTFKLRKYYFPVSNIRFKFIINFSSVYSFYCYERKSCLITFQYIYDECITRTEKFGTLWIIVTYIVILNILYTLARLFCIRKTSIGMDGTESRIKDGKPNYYGFNRVVVISFSSIFKLNAQFLRNTDIGSGLSNFSNYISQRAYIGRCTISFFINKIKFDRKQNRLSCIS